MRLFIKKQHRRGCAALAAVDAGRWNSPWWFPGRRMSGSKSGAIGRGARGLLVVECNAQRCPAWGVVLEDDILTALSNPTATTEATDE